MNISCVSYDTQVSDLQAGHTYRLRVLAVNEAGVGSPSLPTEPVTAQTPPGQPSWLHIYSADFKKLSLQALGLLFDPNSSIYLHCRYFYSCLCFSIQITQSFKGMSNKQIKKDNIQEVDSYESAAVNVSCVQAPKASRLEWTKMVSYFWVMMRTWMTRLSSFGGKTTQSPLIPAGLMKKPKQKGTAV